MSSIHAFNRSGIRSGIRTADPHTEDLELTCDLGQEYTEDLIAKEERSTPPRSAVERPRAPPLERMPAMVAASPGPSVSAAAQLVVEPEPAPRTGIEAGVILHDRFLLERQIGTGGTCLVFRARDMHSVADSGTQSRIALKIPRPDRADRARDSLRLRREYECLQVLSHPNIVRTHELICDERECFFTMELLEGRSLATLQREWLPFPTALAYRILDGAGRALLHAHEQGVIHGDFTPSNVLITIDERVKVLDFGAGLLARPADGPHAAAGTRAYASFEVLSGLPPDPRDDLYSFACLAYELLVGRHPFERKSALEAHERSMTPPRAGSLAAPQWFALVAALAWKRNDRSISLEALLRVLQDGAPVPRRSLAAPETNGSFSADAVAAARTLAEPRLSEDIWPRRHWGWLLVAGIIAVIALLWVR